MVVMEALLNGIPVVATPEAGPLSILTDDKLGVCLPLDVEKWTGEILKYFNQGKTAFSSYRTEQIKSVYNWNVIAAEYYKILFT
jgi:glycosyltransferase involved in cell wall biosynthesis